MRFNFKDKYRRFRAWQESPFSYAMNDEAAHHCNNCGHTYAGNFCPRCGQKASVGAVNWSSVRENIMEIWGVGTRSMMFTLWQLALRPGYLIRDYISGKRQVSFPPVKMLLIVAIISTIVTNLLIPEVSKPKDPELEANALVIFINWAQNNRGWAMLIIFSTFILPTWCLFHHSPRCTAHTLPQGFFIQVFVATFALIIRPISKLALPVGILIPIYILVAYKQLFGYGLWGTLWRLAMCCVAVFCFLTFIIFCTIGIGEKYSEGNTKAIAIIVSSICYVAILGIGWLIGRRGQKKSIEREMQQ